MTPRWLLRFLGGPVDGGMIETTEARELAWVFPCPHGCMDIHGDIRAHLTFEPSMAPPNAEKYRREEIDEENFKALYVLADSDLGPVIEEREKELVGV